MKVELSLTSLLTNLISKSPKQPLEPDSGEDEKKVGTTIRFEPATRRFIESQADHLGISTQEFVAMTFKAIMKATVEPQSTELELMASRFIEIFVAHGIPISDIPTLFPEGALSRSDLLEKKALVDKLSDEVLERTSELFGVNIEWLKGVKNHVYRTPAYRWYKNVDGFAFRLAVACQESRRVRVLFIAEQGLTMEGLLEAKQREDSISALNVGVVIEKEVVAKGVGYKKYEIWEKERWNYWRCRHCLKAIMMFCEKSRVRYDGILLSQESMNSLFDGKEVVSPILDVSRESWHPDQLLWEDDRNLELSELDAIRGFYEEESRAKKYEIAITQPLSIKDWEAFKRGRYETDGVSK